MNANALGLYGNVDKTVVLNAHLIDCKVYLISNYQLSPLKIGTRKALAKVRCKCSIITFA